MTIGTLKTIIASYLGRSSAADLNPSTLTPAGPNIDLGMVAINNARLTAERAHDFRFCETNVSLTIGAAGGLLSAAFITGTVTVTGTLSPDATGDYDLGGVLANGYQFYVSQGGSGSDKFFITFASGSWNITLGTFVASGDYWALSSTSTSPAGSYTAEGAATGTAVVTVATPNVAVKRVKYVSLPVAGSDYQPIEFVAQDQYESRARSLTGRTPITGASAVPALGYPLAYQLGQTLFLAPSSFTLPVTAQLSVVFWQPDYTLDADTDFFTKYGSDYLQWAGILEVNKLFRRFAPKQEGNIDEPAIQAAADQALQTFIAWDTAITKGSSEATLAPFQPFTAFDLPKAAPAQSNPL